MNLRKFDEYELKFSKEPEKFSKRIGISCESLDIFDNEFGSNPTIRWGKTDVLEDNLASKSKKIYNKVPLPSLKQVYSTFSGSPFIPKVVTDRSLVKKMNFPIVAFNEEIEEDFKTYGKYKKSKTNWSNFREKPVSDLKVRALAFKDRLVHLEEMVGGFTFDISPNFKADGIKNILSELNSEYCPDFYEVDLENTSNGWKLTGIGTNATISPIKQVKMYETAYHDAYAFKLPNWFKSKLMKDYVKPYYSSKVLESNVVKPKHSIDYKSAANKC